MFLNKKKNDNKKNCNKNNKMNIYISSCLLYTPNKKPNSIPNSPRRMMYKMYINLVIKTDSDIKNNINSF